MQETERILSREAAIQLYEAIELRHSHRAYTGEPLPQDRRDKLAQFIESGWEPYPGARTRAVLLEGTETTARIFKGFLGSYGSVKDAPALVAFIAQTEDPYFYEATGYMGEQIVLCATRLGFETCWVGGYFRPEVAGEIAGLQPGERVLAVSAVGFAKQSGMAGLYEGLFKFGTKMGKRKPVSELVYLEDVTPPRWFDRAMEAVQIAPSSYNAQPWHVFYHKDGRITVSSLVEYKDKHQLGHGSPNSSRLCCGIAMLHLKVASRALGIEGRWVPEEESVNPIASYWVPMNIEEDLDQLHQSGETL